MPIPAAFDLSGRVAVVTGAGSRDGIGFATARLLAELGAAVLISATTARIEARVSELRTAGFDAAGVIGDLTDTGAASGLVSAALRQWGRLDIVVNNAGMISTANPVFESGTVDSMSLPTWQASLARNLTTAFLVTKAALPAMTSRGWGRIIMMASVTGPVMAIRADVAYATAKAGMAGLTRAVAIDALPGWPAPARPTSPGNAWSWTAATPSPNSAPHPPSETNPVRASCHGQRAVKYGEGLPQVGAPFR